MSRVSALPTSPFDRPDLLDIPPIVRTMQQSGPISRFHTITGDEAWMVTRFDVARRLFSDPRLARFREQAVNSPKVTNSALLDYTISTDDDARQGGNTEEAEATMRALMSRFFSARRMAALEPRIRTHVDNLLSAMAATPPPVDLTRALATPLPTLVICELLGVPYDDRERFHEWSDAVADSVDAERSTAAFRDLYGYMARLLERKRDKPAADVLSDLVTAQEDGTLTADQAATVATGILFAGHATTVVAIQWGALHLLANPGQWESLRRDRSLLPSAVEEMLRRRLSGGDNVSRYARSDIEIDGVTIRAGEAVVINLVGANHDPRAFAQPSQFDITRKPNAHLTFGYGRHACVGQALARVELGIVFDRLVERFPAMRLAAAAEQLRSRDGAVVGGLSRLPVTW